jgi:hypothetical protein
MSLGSAALLYGNDFKNTISVGFVRFFWAASHELCGAEAVGGFATAVAPGRLPVDGAPGVGSSGAVEPAVIRGE